MHGHHHVDFHFCMEKQNGVEQILATGHHHSINKRNVSPTEQFTTISCKRSRVHSETYHQEKDISSFCRDHGPLGLKLEKSPSFINSIQVKLSELAKKKAAQESKMDHEKLKASNFGALHLRIGTWERVCKHEGDLIAKCYYAKKKIVWEILEGALKRKIEIQWSDIIGINAVIRDDDPGVLEIELGNPPTYFLETNPQPRKHTLWQTASDFTGGQAPNCRRHLITFPPGILDKHYEKLLQCDERLFNLSQKPFPTLSSLYFNSNNFYGSSEYPYCNLNRNANEIPPQMHRCHVQKFPIPSGHVHRLQNTGAPIKSGRPCYFVESIVPGVALQLPYAQSFGVPAGLYRYSQGLHLTPEPHTDERATTNYMTENQRSAFLGQGTNISQGPSHILCQKIYREESGIGNTPNNSSGFFFAETADNQILLNDVNSLIELEGTSPNTNNISANQLISKHDQCFVTNHAAPEHAVNQNCVANGLTVMPKPLSWLSPQDMNAETATMIPQRNQSLYHYNVQEPTEQSVETLNPTLIHRWG